MLGSHSLNFTSTSKASFSPFQTQSHKASFLPSKLRAIVQIEHRATKSSQFWKASMPILNPSSLKPIALLLSLLSSNFDGWKPHLFFTFLLLLLSLFQLSFYLSDSGSYASCRSLFPFLGDFTILKFHHFLSVKYLQWNNIRRTLYSKALPKFVIIPFLQYNTISLYLLTSIMSYI